MKPLDIRPVREDDWEWMMEGMLEAAFHTTRPERRLDNDRSTLLAQARKNVERYHARSVQPEQAFVAEMDGHRVGFVWITLEISGNTGEKSGWLLDVYVDPEHRNKGIGKRLMTKAEEWARGHGVKEIWLNAGFFNEEAMALYRSYGYDIETVHMSKRI
jgi:GNAT superfamily N-acetyltransferase